MSHRHKEDQVAIRKIIGAAAAVAIAIVASIGYAPTANATEPTAVSVYYKKACSPGLEMYVGTSCVWKWGPGEYDWSGPRILTSTSEVYISTDTSPICSWDNNTGAPWPSNFDPKVYQIQKRTILTGYFWKTTKYSDGTFVTDPAPVHLFNEVSSVTKYTENRRCSYPKRTCSSYRTPFPVSTTYRYYLDRDNDGWACEK